MKKPLLNAPQKPEVMDALFAEMLLDKALLSFRKEQLRKEIDQSLQDGNKEKFMQLTEELKKLL
ncbi:IDEAL domain-containing protein [Ectobacillus panaciterrae]|uniref:IDEAL domain-containing protein n=1 Tax=Ectobacillus panaciterrae TaxID=363872 RepID=UPI000424B384|nr:IDEAL domain-containing protein [Ectobacillus panaciterrae]